MFRFKNIFVILFVLCALGSSVFAATISVNSLADVAADEGECTLREAIIAANTDAASGATLGECVAGAGDDIINFRIAGLPGTITLTSALPQISTNLEIDSLGANLLAVNGADAYRVFDVASSVTVSFCGLTIENGLGAGSGGGGILANSSSTVDVSNCLIQNNTLSAGSGAGIYNYSATLTVTGCTFTGNNANGYGGGISVYSGNTTVLNSTFDNNSASAGTEGGGLNLWHAPATVINCTFSNNTAHSGSGIKAGGTATSLVIRNSVFANNNGINNTDCEFSGGAGITSVNNLQMDAGDNSCTPANVADALLSPLADNGGPTPTMALQVSSPAIDTGDNASATAAGLTVDQRGYGPRVNGTVDLGAYEYGTSYIGLPCGDGTCDIAIDSVTPTAEGCPGGNDGTITVNASCTGCTDIEYSIDGTNFYGSGTSHTFTGLAPNTYTVTVRDSGDPACIDNDTATVTTAAPTVTTAAAVSSVTSTTAGSGGNVTDEGSGPVTARGVCWSTSADPTVADTCTADGTGAGAFTSTLTDLIPGTTYHVRAYATSCVDTAYGDDVTFSTPIPGAPAVTTAAVSNITPAMATSGGEVTDEGDASVTARGVCWGTSAAPAGNCTTDGTGAGAFTSTLTGLIPGTTYFVRAYATSSVDTAYGNDVTFITPSTDTTSGPPPVATVMYMTSTAADGSYAAGDVIEITVRFSLTVWVSGTPQLVLNTGGPLPAMAYYSSGSGTDTLTFQYTVATGDTASALEYWSQYALELNGGRIWDNMDNDVILELPAPGAPGSLSGDISLSLDTDYPVFRLYSPELLKHLFTMDENEREYLTGTGVWQFDGIAYHAFHPMQYRAASRQQRNMLQAVHRFYSEALQTHLFTIDENEKEYLIANAADVWRYEGAAFYVPAGNPDGVVPVYRFYSEALLVHLFTTDENEKNHLIDTAGDVWRYEGVAYYAYP